MRPEDIIALMKKFEYDKDKINKHKQPHWNLRLPHTTRDEGLCTTIESALFAFGRLSEEGGYHQYSPDILIFKGVKKDEINPFRQSLCLYETDKIHNSIGFLNTSKGFFLKSYKTKKGLIRSINNSFGNNGINIDSISHLNPIFLSEIRRTLRDAQSLKNSHMNFLEVFPENSIIGYEYKF